MMGSCRIKNNITKHSKVLNFEDQCFRKMFDSSIFKAEKEQLITLNILIRCFFGDEKAYEDLMSKTLKQEANFKQFKEVLQSMNNKHRQIRSKEEIESKSLGDFMNPEELFNLMKNVLEKTRKNSKANTFWKNPIFSLQIISIFMKGDFCEFFNMLYSDKEKNVKMNEFNDLFKFSREEHKVLRIFLLLLIFIRNPEVNLKDFQNYLKKNKIEDKKITIVENSLDFNFLYSLVTVAQNDFSDLIRLESCNSESPVLASLYAWIHLPKYICEFLFLGQQSQKRKMLSSLLAILVFELALPLLNLDNQQEQKKYQENYDNLKNRANLLEIFSFIAELKEEQNQTIHWYSSKTIAAMKEIFIDTQEDTKDILNLIKDNVEKFKELFLNLIKTTQKNNPSFEQFQDFFKLFVIFTGYSKFDATEILGENDKISNLLGGVGKLFMEGKELYHFELLTTGLAMGMDIMEQKKRNKFLNSDFWMSKLTQIL